MEGPLYSFLISVNTHGRHRQFLFLGGHFRKTLSPDTAGTNKIVYSCHISCQCDIKYGRHSQFLFLIGQLNIIFSKTIWPN